MHVLLIHCCAIDLLCTNPISLSPSVLQFQSDHVSKRERMNEEEVLRLNFRPTYSLLIAKAQHRNTAGSDLGTGWFPYRQS